MTKFIQKNAPHPGVILLEFYLEPNGLNVTQAAEKLFIARPNMSAIINGKAGISAHMALKLAKAFSTSPMYWMNLQANYDLSMVMKEDKTLDKIEVLV